MEEDIKILEEIIESYKECYVEGYEMCVDVWMSLRDLQAIQNLIVRYKELEEQIQRKDGIIKHLENSKAKYYEDNVCLLRKNGHIDILSDNLHYKYWDDVKNYIPKSKVQDEISYLMQKYDLEEDYINYETVIEILQELLEES